jgi:hypothetical protein
MGIDAALTAAEGEDGTSAADASSGERQPAGSTPLSSHRVVLVQMDQPATSLCPSR